jgi:hypothetical protein
VSFPVLGEVEEEDDGVSQSVPSDHQVTPQPSDTQDSSEERQPDVIIIDTDSSSREEEEEEAEQVRVSVYVDVKIYSVFYECLQNLIC